jgi:CHASE3 domain sensor protein
MMIIIIGTFAAIVTIAIGVTSAIRWIYRQGQESGKAQAEYQADRRAQDEVQAKIQTMEARLSKL